MNTRRKNLITSYLMIGILLFSGFSQLYLLVKHPGTNFIQTPPEEIQRMLSEAEISESQARLMEHTWEFGSRDAYLYAKMTNQWIEHGVYGFDSLNTGEIESNAFVTPGFPILLAGIFSAANLFNADQMLFVKLFNMLLNLGTIFLLYLLSARLFKNKWMGITASLLYASYFSPLHFFRTALTEVPGIFTYLLAFYLFLLAYETNKKKFHFLFAAVFCFGLLIRPILAPVVLLLYLAVIIKHRKFYKEWVTIGLIWALGSILVIGPWVVRNYLLYREFVLFSTHSANSWYAGSNPYNLFDFSDYWRERESLGMETKDFAFMKIREGFQNEFNLWFSWFTVGKTYELFKIPDAIYFYRHWTLPYFKLQHEILVIIGFLTAFLVRKKEVLAVALILLTYLIFSNLFLTIPRYGYYIIPLFCILNGYAWVTVIEKIIFFARMILTQIKTAI
ncbi:glycosyltransferase family 39 protein [Jeotgalibacillus proteolyticus]|uniref:4-amino-4-deoxy-L-arabinose transferase n=1 Tax=Jeotgalibacillus proteolyticus TaxID=2082395 RepID=A0A2S5GB97_9BACL|nr:glycosyltransferase family 39 protein [Jeotgalibacillus proteolyticus]PPA70270.1 4-amino-4-deoxy-L-arabinose transferase [Jeotgalibacillus proteolyticus]